MLYPLKFMPVMKDYIWGGRNLEKWGKKLPAGIIAESWEISGHPDGPGTVAEGPLAGCTLPEVIRKHGRELVGTALPVSALETFPLLVKFIDANDRLSVQVHPDDEYARVHENGGLGKTEMWVVLDAEPGAKLVYGLEPGVTKEHFALAVAEGNVASCLHEVSAQPGDVFDIPAGLVHAIGAGLVIAEIQQSSNTTYRVYDYDRTDALGNRRPLHIEKALEVIDFGPVPTSEPPVAATASPDGTLRTLLVKNSYFVVERLDVSGSFHAVADGSRFGLLICIGGDARLSWADGDMTIRKGDSLLVPAALGTWSLEGTCTALHAWVP